MRRRFRFRRFAKWVGIGFCALIALVWVISGWWHVAYVTRSSRIVAMEEGGLAYYTLLDPVRIAANGEVKLYELGVSVIRVRGTWQLMPTYFTDGTYRHVFVGCWIPLLLIALPTGLLFWRDRRRFPVGYCNKCGYDLTGNTSSRCPECGTGVRP